MNRRYARNLPLGLPGGPCHVIRNVEDAKIPDRAKQDIIQDLESGKDIKKQWENTLYPDKKMRSRIDLFQGMLLTSHAQYRMDLRGITIYDVQAALDEFQRWYIARKKSSKDPNRTDRKMMEDLAYGDPVQFDAQRSGLTIVFKVSRNNARLVTTWWTNIPNPPRPRPGQCDFIPFLDDRERSRDRPRILGASMLMKKLGKINQILIMNQSPDGCKCCKCCGNCGCGSDCGCKNCNCECSGRCGCCGTGCN